MTEAKLVEFLKQKMGFFILLL